MMLIDVIDAYLAKQRSPGMRFESAGHLLRQFCRAMGDPEIDEVTPEAVAEFLQGGTALTATWMLKYRVLTGLYRFAVSRGYVCRSPLPTTLPKLPPQQTPYVYSTEELRRLLEATSILRIGHCPQVPAMYHTLLLLLYGNGMRMVSPRPRRPTIAPAARDLPWPHQYSIDPTLSTDDPRSPPGG
jgi:integrase